MSEIPIPHPDESLRRLTAGLTVFGRFVLDRVLGQGGMGVVWKARDEALEKDVALKFVLESRSRDTDAVAVLKHETRRCQELRHAGIVAIYDLHQDDDHVAVSMEYVAGETLAVIKAERGTGVFDAEEIMPWLEQLDAALTYAHNEARVVHRDLKPSNLILTEGGRVKVMDFGISHQIAETSVAKTTTGVEGISLPYGSPQQLMGERARVADDVYSLAATIYDLLSGRPPFFRGKLDVQVLEAAPPSMGERRQELGRSGKPIPWRWEEIIASALAKEPDDRPPSIRAMVSALREGLSSREEAVPIVKIAVPKVTGPVPPPSPVARPPVAVTVSESTTSKPPAPVGWVPTSDVRQRFPEGRWPLTAVLVLALSALTAYALHLARHAWAPVPMEIQRASVSTPGPRQPAALRPALLEPSADRDDRRRVAR